MNQETAPSLERRISRQAEVVSNMNSFRTGQLMDEILRADRKTGLLRPGKQLILVERNPAYLEELLAKILPEICPRHLVSYQEHHLPHYVVKDGKVECYKNLDEESPVVMVIARVKHPCSVAEKVPRKIQYFGRVSERHDKHKLMIGDVLGIEIVVKSPEYVTPVMQQVLGMPFLELEHYEAKRQKNGYNSDHANMKYNNGNPAMRDLEIEIQVTNLQSHKDSKKKPEQGHDTGYGALKLASNHNLGDRQLVIVGNSVQIPDACKVRRTDGFVLAQVPSHITPYLLAVPRQD